jgi:hypothetical protein
MTKRQQTGDPRSAQNRCQRCGHPAFAHTVYASGAPSHCWGEGPCDCKTFHPRSDYGEPAKSEKSHV